MSATTDIRAFDEKIEDARAEWARLETENDRILATAPYEGKTLIWSEDRQANFSANLAKIRECRAVVDSMTEAKSLREYGNGAATDSIASAAAAGLTVVTQGGTFAPARPQGKTLGEMFTGSEAFKEYVASGRGSMEKGWDVNMADIARVDVKWLEKKDIFTDLPSGDIPLGFAPIQRDDIVTRAMRRMRVRDLFNVQKTSAAVIEFFRGTGYVGGDLIGDDSGNSASPVPERTSNAFTLKPQTELQFESIQSPVRVIAHWEMASRTVLADVPQLQGIIDNELMYGLRLREDDQILNGAGTGADLLGILNTPNVQSFTRAGMPPDHEQMADDIRRATTKVILAQYEATGVVMHPNDWEQIELIKDDQGRYVVSVAVALGAEQRVWRLPVVDTPAMTEGTFLVGAFGLGSNLYDREEGSIRVSEHDSDNFRRNAVTVLAEQRLAIATKRPESFVKGTFGDNT